MYEIKLKLSLFNKDKYFSLVFTVGDIFIWISSLSYAL